MAVREIKWEVKSWIHLVQDRGLMAGPCVHGKEPLGTV